MIPGSAGAGGKCGYFGIGWFTMNVSYLNMSAGNRPRTSEIYISRTRRTLGMSSS